MKPYDTNSVKGRIRLYVEKIEKKEMASFERKAGIAPGTLSRTDVSLSMLNLMRIVEAAPRINFNWVLRGNGPITTDGDRQDIHNEGQAGQVAGNVYNMSEVKNIAVETVCEEVKTLTKIITDLRKEKEGFIAAYEKLEKTNQSLHAENIKQLKIIDDLIAKLG